MSEPLVTIGWSTGQVDYPIKAYPKTHVFEYTMASLRNQTFKDFEVVISDVYYHTRSNYFQRYPEDFPVVHVPVKPNVWIKHGYPAIAASKNTYLIYARGKYILNIGDCYYFDDKFVERILQNLKNHRYVGNRFARSEGKKLIKLDPRQTKCPRVGGQVSMLLEDYLDLNGYNEMFDGSKGHEDIDLGMRICAKDGELDLILVSPAAVRQTHYPFPSFGKWMKWPYKCSLLSIMLARKRAARSIYKANIERLSYEELKCYGFCGWGDSLKCLANSSGKCRNIRRDLTEDRPDADMVILNNHPSLYFDLRKQRENPVDAMNEMYKLVHG